MEVRMAPFPKAETEKAKFELQSALLGTGLVQPVSVWAEKGTIEILCRQVPGQEKGWIRVVEELLKATDGSSVGEIHLCRRYVMRDRKMVFGWHFGITMPDAKALVSIVETVMTILAKAKPSLDAPAEEPGEQPAQKPATRSGRALAPGQHPPRRAPQPRPPGEPAVLGPKPPGRVEGIRVVRRTVNEKTGAQVIEEEMPLPHVYRDLNEPTRPGARGAQSIAEEG
jgi:hypothetical protein